ncbi:sn-glycerol-3-phosphate ABC transporter ATP-binding protein UgpC [Agrobacterium vitis]|uniref:ABC transporter ATP-binding protein n=1 Tax=Rhizobium/Agrobacterium group TaxID=227290 RepID=UPI0012E914EB|nr:MULTISPECIES: ABC transporter ATP-binding protein [Rhizobium/Agrobacterium group]MCF1494365.1 ABC transporter ATP-binding protein [Allorhizobium ampelinum]MUZ66104.1 sn-glycerol-3-phosphate ABC transporter ATP-binding protein UgpC [Agrobacterium vitis]MVA45871.1 sn-glycerol-3-phosphate ABC transporter ATP-binding protein UgpC [Agrobacterium vitis]
MSGLSLKAIRKRYGTHDVLHGIDLEAEHGEFVVLVGPSGCGKSTLLRMIAGLDDTTSGELHIAGRSVTNVPPQQRNIAMVFQSYALFPHLRVNRNISFGMELRGTDRHTISEKVALAAKTLNLSHYLERFPRELSGGQRQRVAMARALVREPSLYLMDEPLSNLDAQLRVKMRAEIKALHQRLGNTIVYVTHDQVEAMTLADRLVVMRAGKIEQEGSPLDIYDNPANTFVAEFLGSPSINLFDAHLENGMLGVAGSDVRWPTAERGQAGTTVVAGVRPDACHIDATGIAGHVALVESMGSEAIVHIDTKNGQMRVLERRRPQVKPGDQVHINFPADRILLFRKEDGIAI